MFAGQTLSPYQRAYAYMLARGGIDTFMSNMPNVKILEENLAVPTLKLPQASLDAIERKAILEARGSCRHCGACSRSCPNAVGPADLLRCHSYLYHYGDAALARETYESIGAGRVGRCATCGTCRAACPEHIDLPAVIAGLRDALA